MQAKPILNLLKKQTKSRYSSTFSYSKQWQLGVDSRKAPSRFHIVLYDRLAGWLYEYFSAGCTNVHRLAVRTRPAYAGVLKVFQGRLFRSNKEIAKWKEDNYFEEDIPF